MAKLLTILSLVLVVILFPPAALALISNNAVPGDRTYPIKRGLEDIIFSIASINPVTKAMFSAARSDRRFQELNGLVIQGKQAGETLDELVEQTQTAANQITQVTDQNQKQKLVEQLSASIEKYDKGLEKLSATEIALVPQSAPEVSTDFTPNPTSQPTVTPTISPGPKPSPNPKITTTPTSKPSSTPTPTIQPTVRPTPTPIPVPASNRDEEERKRQLEEARRKLEEIQRQLRQSKTESKEEHKDSNLTPRDETDKIKKEKR